MSAKALRRLCLGWFLLIGLAAPAYAADTPMDVIKRNQAKVMKILKQKIKKGDTKAKARQEEKLRKIVRPFMDFRYLGRQALSNHWAKLTPVQRERFLFWLEALLDAVYVRNLHQGRDRDAKNVKIKYRKQKIKKKKATVYTLIRVKNKRTGRWGKVRVNWVFYHNKKSKTWMVMDVVTNDNSLIETYQEQFDKIINKKSFADLIKRITKKVKQLRKKDGLPPLKEPASLSAKAKPAKR